jgi:peptide/nickel transport system permease protein
MKKYVLQRLLAFIPTLFIVALLMFLFAYLVPGDITAVMLGPDATPEQRAQLREQLGLDQPMYVQMRIWFGNVLQGDLGYSYTRQENVTTTIVSRLPVTASLAVMALFASIAVGVPAGLIAAVKRQTWLDSSVMFGSVLGLSVPNFWLGLNLIFLFAVVLGWLPTGGYTPWTEGPWETFKRLILPATALGLSGAAVIARMTRSAMLEVLDADYITSARAKGLSPFKVNVRHAFRNAVIPVATVIGIVFGSLLNGSVIVETVFNLRGVGRMIVEAGGARDIPMLQGGILFVTVIYLTVNLIVDLLYVWLDPRIKYTN